MMSTLKPTSYFIEPIRYWKPKFCRAATGPGIGASPRAESLGTVPLVIAVGEYQAAVNRRKSPRTAWVPVDLFSQAFSGDDVLAVRNSGVRGRAPVHQRTEDGPRSVMCSLPRSALRGFDSRRWLVWKRGALQNQPPAISKRLAGAIHHFHVAHS
jgi:hypothetical protein